MSILGCLIGRLIKLKVKVYQKKYVTTYDAACCLLRAAKRHVMLCLEATD